MRKKPYVQFSKRVVVAVTVSVTILCYLSIVLMFIIRETQYMADVLKMYIAYAMVVFAAYSGNSAIQKALASGRLSHIISGKINAQQQLDES